MINNGYVLLLQPMTQDIVTPLGSGSLPETDNNTTYLESGLDPSSSISPN
jgi:hypothetical protein